MLSTTLSFSGIRRLQYSHLHLHIWGKSLVPIRPVSFRWARNSFSRASNESEPESLLISSAPLIGYLR